MIGKNNTPISADPSVKCVEFHRAFTCGDNRVFVPHKSLFAMQMLEAAQKQITEPHEQSDDLERMEAGRRCTLSGGGDLDDYPLCGIATAGHFRISLVEDVETTIQKIEEAAA